MLDRVPVLASLWTETETWLRQKASWKQERNAAEATQPHRGAYGTGGGGGMYKSRIAGFSFLADLLAEPHGD